MTTIGELKQNGLECSFQIAIDNDSITKRSQKISKDYFKTNVPRGFRKGKVPAGFKANEFRSSAISQMLNDAVNKRIQELNLKPFVEPEVSLVQNESGQDVICKVDVITLPELDFAVFENNKADTIKYEIPQEEVNNSKLRLLDDFSKWEKVEEAVDTGKGVSLSFAGLDDKKLRLNFLTETDLNKAFIKRVIGSMVMSTSIESDKKEKCIQSIYDAILTLKGKVKGDQLKVKNFKEIEIKIDEVSNITAPEITTEFLQQLGVADGSEASLEKSLNELLEFQTKKKISDYYYHQFSKFCAKSLKFEVPQVLVDKETSNNESAEPKSVAENLKLNMVLSALIQAGKIEIDEEQVAAEVNFQLQSMGGFAQQNEKMYSMLQNYARNTVATNQAVAFAISKMKQSDTEISYLDLDDYLTKHMD